MWIILKLTGKAVYQLEALFNRNCYTLIKVNKKNTGTVNEKPPLDTVVCFYSWTRARRSHKPESSGLFILQFLQFIL